MRLTLTSAEVKIRATSILQIPQCEIDRRPTLLLGVNGAGKSTLLSVLAGHQKLSAGHIDHNCRIIKIDQHFQPIIGFTVSEYCSYVAWLSGRRMRDARNDTRQWLEFVGLLAKAGQKCQTLSGGEQARLAIATALNSAADMLLLDEPSAALDPLSKEHLTTIFQKIVAEGRGLMVSTHDSGDVMPPFERVLVLDRGTIVFDGTLDEFLQQATAKESSTTSALAASFAKRRGIDGG